MYKGRRKNLVGHKKSRHGSQRFKCDICSYMSTRLEHLNWHTERVHDNLFFSCDMCDYKCNSRHSLQGHKNDYHSNILHPCEKCDFETLHRRRLTYCRTLKRFKDLLQPQSAFHQRCHSPVPGFQRPLSLPKYHFVEF